MNSISILENLLLTLPSLHRQHAPGSKLYGLLKQVAHKEIESLFDTPEPEVREFKPFGELIFPYHKMGAVDSLNLFDLDELILFSFYWINRHRYRRVLDIGANIGLHAILLSKCGYDVRAYEPDSHHFELLEKNLTLNHCANVQAFNAAVSSQAGNMEFVRVLGNTTGSHLAGSKLNPYGDLERFSVKVESIQSLIPWADLIKLDVEGHEKEVLLATHRNDWLNTDALIEVGGEENAEQIYQHFTTLGVQLFSQKKNWQRVDNATEMPASYRDGLLFVTCKEEMPWAESHVPNGSADAGGKR
jgi:FkbM family methyltransferase